MQRAGLVELTNGTRARVALPSALGVLGNMLPAVRHLSSSPEGQLHLHAVRTFLEVGLARQAARDANAAQIAALEAALRDNEAAIGDTAAFIETDVRFHFVVAEMSANPVIIALHDAMSVWLKQQRVLTQQVAGTDRVACDAHRGIFDAIRMHHPDAAEKAMEAHMRHVGEVLDRHRDTTPGRLRLHSAPDAEPVRRPSGACWWRIESGRALWTGPTKPGKRHCGRVSAARVDARRLT